MKHLSLDREWEFRRGFLDSVGMLETDPGVEVNLPHDAMIGTEVSEDAEAGSDSGYFKGVTCNYTKFVSIDSKWSDGCVGLLFDGTMMHTTIDVNGCKVAEHHYGYSPYFVDITDYVTFGEKNRITINVNSGIQPSSRWYTGCGIFREVDLVYAPKIHIAPDGIYLRTLEVSDGIAFLEGQIDICNQSLQNHLVRVTVSLFEDIDNEGCQWSRRADISGDEAILAAKVSKVIQVNPGTVENAKMAINVKNPKLWDIDSPNLYNVKATVEDLGEFRTNLIPKPQPEHQTDPKSESDFYDKDIDTENTLFGIRTITVDSIRGLQINKKTVKLKGGCVHHDNGLLGSISLYAAEVRRVKKLKEVGFNAIRTAHNPPSAALVEACDRYGMYIFDEAFDAWGMGKRVGDYSQYFSKCWEEDLTAFVKRDRVHPSVIMWSTGNEIPERGGLDNGYTLATKIANVIKKLDSDRPVSNGICSFWSGLDDKRAQGQNSQQNAKDESNTDFWEKNTEPFTNGLDVVGYNYMEELYERDHELYPERVILGSENFPKEIGYRWPMVEKLPYVIGDFTWTCWDYIGEAGIGKALYVDKDDPMASKKPWDIMPPSTTYFPWRLANDADFDITGRLLPQGAYRSVVWGSKNTYLYTYSPSQFGKVELMSMWGFPVVKKNWNFRGCEGAPIELMVFSNADEVELLINGKPVERKAVGMDYPMPNSVRFDTVYQPGVVEAVSYRDGKEVSRDRMETSSAPATLKLTMDKKELRSDGHDAVYIDIDVLDKEGRPVTDVQIDLDAEFLAVTGDCVLRTVYDRVDELECAFFAGFGTGNPITSELYTDDTTVTYEGHACAIVRGGYWDGYVTLKIKGSCIFEGTPIFLESEVGFEVL